MWLFNCVYDYFKLSGWYVDSGEKIRQKLFYCMTRHDQAWILRGLKHIRVWKTSLELLVIKFVCHLRAVLVNDSLFDNNYGVRAINNHFLRFTLNAPYFAASLLVLPFRLLFRRYGPLLLSLFSSCFSSFFPLSGTMWFRNIPAHK